MSTETGTRTTAQGPAANGVGRSRAYYGYSRNGCSRCKQQRVRCDERHPECDRCIRVGVKCPGFEQKLRWSAKHEVFHGNSASNSASSGVAKPSKPRNRSGKPSSRASNSKRDAVEEEILAQAAFPASFSPPSQQTNPAPMMAQPEQHRRRSQSTSSPVGQQEPSPASLTSSTEPMELPALNGDMGPTEPMTLHTTTSPPTWDPSCLDLLNQLASTGNGVPEFLMGLDGPFLTNHNPPSPSLFLDGMMPSPDAVPSFSKPMPTTSLPETNEALHQPMPLSLASMGDMNLEELWRGAWSPSRVLTRSDTNSPAQILQSSALVATGFHHPDAVTDTDSTGTTTSDHALATLDDFSSPITSSSPPSSTREISYQDAARSPSPLTVSVNDVGTMLVEFYFKETAQIYSCYDGRMNPFRTAVTRLWASSEIINCTAQSMAAACLLRDFPQVASVGRQLRQKAINILSKTKTWDTNTMLAVLMLGGTASWHDSKDLGLRFFHQIAQRLSSAPASVFNNKNENHRTYRFFYESMLYWEMLLAFMTDGENLPLTPDSGHLSDRNYGTAAAQQQQQQLQHQNQQQEYPYQFQNPFQNPHRFHEQHQHQEPLPKPPPVAPAPHPWTGFASETQRTVQKVGRLIRRQRKFDSGHRFASLAHITQLQKDMETARELESRLVDITHPTEQTVKDTEDRNTPVWHLLTLAEAIRDVGLIQLYHVFPDILNARLRRERVAASRGGVAAGVDADANITPQFCRKWLTAYTLQTLDLLKTIPVESGTRDFQPFLLVALSSELRSPAGGGGGGSQPPLSVGMETVEVVRARGFIHSRLKSFVHILPPKPLMICLQIVQETWRQMDIQAKSRALVASRGPALAAETEADVYWMDVMIENGWETIMG